MVSSCLRGFQKDTLSLAGRWIATKIFNLSCNSVGSTNSSFKRWLFLKMSSNDDFFLKMRSKYDLLPTEKSIFAKLSILLQYNVQFNVRKITQNMKNIFLVFPWNTCIIVQDTGTDQLYSLRGLIILTSVWTGGRMGEVLSIIYLFIYIPF